MKTKQKDQILLFSWFPRTNIHLREIYDFLDGGKSEIPQLEEKRLKDLYKKMEIVTVRKGFDNIEFVAFKTKGGIETKLYADGLVLLKKEMTDKNHSSGKEELQNYYQNYLSKALIYIFSIGAPVLYHKNIWDVSNPVFVIKEGLEKNENPLFGDEYISMKKVADDEYTISYQNSDYDIVEKKVSEVAFLKILKDMVHTFLKIHRDVWNSIDNIYKDKKISGKDLDSLDELLSQHQKTSNKIIRRLNTFDLYIKRRLAINDSYNNMDGIKQYIDSKYGFLDDSLKYIANLWQMTDNYIKQTSSKTKDIENKINSASIKNITVIAIVGVGTSIITTLTKVSSVQNLKDLNFTYLIILIVLGYLGNKILREIYLRKKYEIQK